jgi:ABC-type lipoprotein release transport system permease subunit
VRAYLDKVESGLRGIPRVNAELLVKLPPLAHTMKNVRLEINGRTVTVYPNWVTPERPLGNVSHIHPSGRTIVRIVGMVEVSLAAVGINGLVAFVVTQRSKEVAICTVFGATPGTVLSEVL